MLNEGAAAPDDGATKPALVVRMGRRNATNDEIDDLLRASGGDLSCRQAAVLLRKRKLGASEARIATRRTALWPGRKWSRGLHGTARNKAALAKLNGMGPALKKANARVKAPLTGTEPILSFAEAMKGFMLTMGFTEIHALLRSDGKLHIAYTAAARQVEV